MAPLAIFFGVLLSLLGPILFSLSERPSPTVFIPTGFGIALILCGVVAFKESIRMHAMHVAALLGLIGFAIPAFRVAKDLVEKGTEFDFNLSMQGQVAMSILCLAFLLLCIRSFIAARIAQEERNRNVDAQVRAKRTPAKEFAMTTTKTIEEKNRELGVQVLEDVKRNPHNYAGKYIGIANGKVVIVSSDLKEIMNRLKAVEPVPTRCFIVDTSRDPDKVYQI